MAAIMVCMMPKCVRIAETRVVPRNKMRVFKVGGREVLIVNVEGKFYAFENRCPHMGYSLFFGSLEGKVLTCGFHYAKFNVVTGKSFGAVTQKSLKTFEVKIRDSSILVEV
jgi:nitrite reductase/ring-hydroxylating ferredoxin subunit